jgi:hypothetical protein
MSVATIGLRAKTGRAIAVVLQADRDAPLFAWRGQLDLVGPTYTAPEGPYHEVLGLPWPDAQVAIMPLVQSIERVAEEALGKVIAEMRSRKIAIRGVGVIGSPARSLDRIGNEHIRAHAAEGILFRRVLERAAAEHDLPCCAFSEKEIDQAIDLDTTRVRSTMKRLGAAAGPPWRTDERLAATAAWIALRNR